MEVVVLTAEAAAEVSALSQKQYWLSPIECIVAFLRLHRDLRERVSLKAYNLFDGLKNRGVRIILSFGGLKVFTRPQ